MSARKISPQSLKNLYQSNKEANQITRESLETALLFLLKGKDMKQISISELVKKAGVSRNAFYRNYKSKEEILEDAYERATHALSEKWSQVQEQGISNSLGGFLSQQKDKVIDSQAFSNVSQWIKEHTKKD